MRASRVAWEIHNGPIQDGLFVLHKCDNPNCVNPMHLFLGTQRDNMQDMIKKGRRPATKRIVVDGVVICKRGHAKVLLPNETEKYVCPTCQSEWQKQYRERQRRKNG